MSATRPGRLVLVPNTLDFGAREGAPVLTGVLPHGVIEQAARLLHWVAEDAKTTRAFLKRVDAVVPLAAPLQAIQIRELPRAQKGPRDAAAATDLRDWLAPAQAGHDLGLISEAGLPGVADPGAALVEAAHRSNIEVLPLPGASSLLLAVAASGLNGQRFAFVGYLPIEAGERASRLRELELRSRRDGETQIIIETPYRNPALLGALLQHLAGSTRLSVSCGLTLTAGAFNRSDSIAGWKQHPREIAADLPAVYAFLAG
jgi:16S rRNA (cytidine1402-2'-O)-methyltransferase